MADRSDILFSEYIIDGASMESTPADMLKECMPVQMWEQFLNRWHNALKDNGEQDRGVMRPAPIIDETRDKVPVNFKYESGRTEEYLEKIFSLIPGRDENMVNPEHPFSATRIAVASSILSSLWKEGHFRLNNLDMAALWEWDTAPVGNMAAFYNSVEAATGYVYDLGVKLTSIAIRERQGVCRAGFVISGVQNWMPFDDALEYVPDMDAEDVIGPEAGHPQEKIWLRESRKCPGTVVLDDSVRGDSEGSWLVYIPFDTCSHKLGGSMLSEVLGKGNENGPEISDPDYFIDCFEVVRELVEDGVVMSGVSVGQGGLAAAVARMLGRFQEGGLQRPECGIDLDISGIEQAYVEADPIRVLFSEIPGAVIQISSADYDYVDAQLMLQDIAYYPLGHPVADGRPVRLTSSSRTKLSAILAALMDGQSSEGED